MPAFGRRTPQRQLVDGRPKRQAVLNRKETLDLTKGISKTESPIKSKEESSGKASPATNKNKNDENDEKPTSTTQKIQPNKTNKKTTRTKKSPSTATRRSSRKKKSEDESEDTKNDKIEEEKVEEENPNEIKLNDDEKKNNTDSQNEETEDSEEDKESEPDDGEIDDDDDDFDPDEDPDKLWCFCKKTHGNRFMICCDTCEEWFHGECVGITMSKGREMEKTGEEWCCRVCKENAAKKQAKISPVKSALNSPLKKPSQTTQKPLDPATLTKARSLSLDSIKNNLGKKIKDRNLTLSSSSPSNKGNSDTKCAISENNDNTQKATDTPSKADKRKESTDKNSFSNLLTFDHVPKKKEEKATSYHRKGSSTPSSERRESIDIDFEKKRKDRDAQNKAKVRVTPTPKSIEPVKQCHRDECTKPVIKGSIYCSRECIYKYTNDSIKYLENERRKNLPVESSKTTSKGTTIISPAHSTTDAVPMETTQERIAVFDKATGKVVAGVMAPTKKYLFAWLEEHPTFEVLKSGKQTDVRNPKKNQDEVVRMNVRKSLREVLTSRCKDSQISINVEAIGKLSKRIENELLKLFGGETNQKYKTKYRSLIFNLKDNNNKILYKRVVSGEINSNKLVNMSPEQLATPELARWREHESKHGIEMIKKRELEEAEMKKYSGVKKTHKGEVEIEGENENLEILEAKAEPLPEVRKASVSSDTVVDLLKDTTDEHNHHLFDSNCKICTGKLPPPGESQVTGVSTTVIQAIPESSVPSPSIEDDISLNSPPSPDTSVSLTPTSPKIAPPPSVRKQPSVWRGFVMMQKVAKFVCTAYAVSGTCENLMEILPDTIHVCGRIPPNQVWEYLAQLKEGRKESKYIDVIRFEMSSDEEKTGYIKLYTYFYTRQRIGVVGNCYSGVKDMYILPLASHDAIPNELKPLPGLPKPRPHMLVGIIVRVKKDPKKSLSDTMSIDSSPDSIAPKKKKKMKKEKEQLEKEKIEIEAQKKLIDIIFKNRSSDLANIDDAAEVTKELDPVSLLNSIASGSSTATTTSASKDSSEAQQSTNMGAVTGFGHDMVELKSEEEQLRLLREQQEEIDKLKAKLNIDKSTIMTTDTDDTSIQQGSEMETVSIPDPQSMAESLKDIKTLYQKEEKDLEEKQKETSLTDQVKSPNLIKSSTESVTSPTDSTDTPTDRRQYSISKTNNSTSSTFPEEFQDIYDASATAEIMREALQRTEKDEKDEASLKAEKEVKRLQIPLLGSMTSSSTSPMTKEIQPSDDDYVMNLIENIKIPTNVSSTQSPLEVLKNRSENKMPGLPAIDLPSSGGLPPMIPPPIPGVIPKVPIPPDIKLPPGVPFPPLPPPILASGPEPSRENSDAYETNDMDYRHRQPFAGPHNYDRPSNFGRHQNSGSHSRFDDTSRMDPRNQTNTSDPRYQNNFERPRHDYHNQGPDMNERPDFVDAGNLGYQNNTRDPRKVQSLTDGNFHPMGSDPNRPFDPQHSQSVDPEHNRTFGPDHGRQLGPDHKRQFGPDYNRPIVQDHNRYVDPNYLSPETHDRRMFSPLLNVAPEPEHRSLSWREYERRRNNQHEGDYLPPDQNWEPRNDRDNILRQSQQPPLDNYDHRHVGPAHPGGQQLQNTFGTNYDNNNIHRQDIQPSADQFHQPLCNGPSNNRSFSREPPHHGPERFDNPRYPGPPPMPPFQPQNNQIPHMPPNTDNRMPSGGLIRNPNHGTRPDFRLPQQQDPQFQNIEVGFDLGTSASEVFPVRQPPGRDFQQPHVPTGQFHHGQHPPENVSQDPGFINKSFQPHPPMDMNMLRPSFPPQNQRFTTPSAFGSNNTNQEQSYGGFVESSGFHQQQQQNTGLENPEQRFGNSNEPKPLMPQEFRPRGRKPWEREKDNYNNRDSGHRGRDNSRDRNDNKANRDKDRPRYNDDRQHSRQLQDYDRDRNRDNRRDRKRRYSDTENSNKDWKRNEPHRSDDERRKCDTSGSIVNQQSSNETNANASNFQQKQKREELEDGELLEHDGGDNQWKKSPANNRDSNWRRENNKDNGGYKPWKK